LKVAVEVDSAKNKKSRRKAGLAYWMRRVLKECDQVNKDLAADPVHDLRVALRRCRSMADGLRAMDPDKSWKQMKKASKPLFQSLGDLRDMQVMTEWVQRLGNADDPVTKALEDFITEREKQLKQEALKALHAFDRKSWNLWCKELPRRAARIRLGSLVFKHLALERWTEARRLQAPALRTHNPTTLHRLRIGLKRFRYTVENFLPQLDAKWSDDLKELQDMLGEVHDLDVLWNTANQIRAFPDEGARTRWHTRIHQERQQRIEKYREKMTGINSLWEVWRAELPQGEQIRSAALARLKIWASFLDPDFLHSQRVADLATQLYDGLSRNGLRAHGDHELRTVLYAAALMHDVGLSGRRKGHHKESSRLIRRLTPPLGLTAEHLKLAGAVARYHRGALPRARHKALANLTPEQKAIAVRLAGILRFVNALDPPDASRIPRHHVKSLEVRDGKSRGKDCVLYVYAQGFSRFSRLAENVAAARYLLEVTLRRPVIVRRLNQTSTQAPQSSASTLGTRRQSGVGVKSAA
jgi:CHAD domain-containing protein